MYRRRFGICMSGGVLSALICILGSQIIHGFPPLTINTVAATVANRLLLGFVIGISGWGTQYLLHGATLGLILSLTVSIGFSSIMDFALYTSAGIIYGMMIEYLSTIVFKSPMRPRGTVT